MVAAVPTFQSTRVTKIPDMGIVSQNGTRALGQSFESIGNALDQFAEVQNERLDRKMKRDMQRQGQEFALSKGFDPEELEEPVTTADAIFRESALNTYAIELENDITSNINQFYVQNLKNPNGFKVRADEYVKSTVSKLPFELKNAATKLAGGMAEDKYASINLAVTKQAMAEQEAAEKSYLAKLADQIVLAESPEERQNLMTKIDGTLSNSATYLTSAGKNAAKQELVDQILYDSEFQDVARGNTTPMQAMDRLASQGIALDNTEIAAMYSAINRKQAFDDAQIARSEANRERNIENISNQYMMDAYDMQEQGVSEDQFSIALETSLTQMRQSGASVKELQSHKQSMTDTFYNRVKSDNDAATVLIDEAIFNGENDAVDTIDGLFNKGLITAKTRQDKIEKATTELSSPVSSAIFKDFINNEFIPKYAAYANYNPADVANITDTGLKDKINRDKQKLEDVKRRFIDLVNNEENALNYSEAVTKINSDYRANVEPLPLSERANVDLSRPEASKVLEIINTPELQIYGYNESGGRVTLDGNNTPALKGPFSQENYVARVKIMIDQNKRAEAAGRQPLYTKNELQGILDAFSK